MNNDQRLIDAFEDCINRLNGGQSIEDCLRVYPDLAHDLHPMLLAGESTKQLRADRAEIDAMTDRISALLEEEIHSRTIPFPGQRWFQLVAVFAAVILLAVMSFTTWQRLNTVVPGASGTETPAPTETPTCVPTAPPDWIEYTAVEGDTMTTFAEQFLPGGDEVNAFFNANCLAPDVVIIAGETYFIPAPVQTDDDANGDFEDDEGSEDEDDESDESEDES